MQAFGVGAAANHPGPATRSETTSRSRGSIGLAVFRAKSATRSHKANAVDDNTRLLRGQRRRPRLTDPDRQPVNPLNSPSPLRTGPTTRPAVIPCTTGPSTAAPASPQHPHGTLPPQTTHQAIQTPARHEHRVAAFAAGSNGGETVLCRRGCEAHPRGPHRRASVLPQIRANETHPDRDARPRTPSFTARPSRCPKPRASGRGPPVVVREWSARGVSSNERVHGWGVGRVLRSADTKPTDPGRLTATAPTKNVRGRFAVDVACAVSASACSSGDTSAPPAPLVHAGHIPRQSARCPESPQRRNTPKALAPQRLVSDHPHLHKKGIPDPVAADAHEASRAPETSEDTRLVAEANMDGKPEQVQVVLTGSGATTQTWLRLRFSSHGTRIFSWYLSHSSRENWTSSLNKDRLSSTISRMPDDAAISRMSAAIFIEVSSAAPSAREKYTERTCDSV